MESKTNLMISYVVNNQLNILFLLKFHKIHEKFYLVCITRLKQIISSGFNQNRKQIVLIPSFLLYFSSFLRLSLQHKHSMQNHYTHSNCTAVQNLKIQQNQDANAIVIDLMLVNLRVLVKKISSLRKQTRQLSQLDQPLTVIQADLKITDINNQLKNMNLTLQKNIPPDKRMTNLFYMRMCRQIARYQKIIPSLFQVLPMLQENYSGQCKSQVFSILSLYVICQKKVIQEVNLVKRKFILMLEEMKTNTFSDKTNSQLLKRTIQIVENELLANGLVMPLKKTSTCNKSNRQNSQQTINEIVYNIVISELIVHNINDVMKKALKSDFFLDFQQRIPQIFSNLYNPLDLGQLQITNIFVTTLRPQDNIDIIYRKIYRRNQKARKQIKQFQAQHDLFLNRRQQLMKRRGKKVQTNKFRTHNFIAKQTKLSLKIIKQKMQLKEQSVNIVMAKKYSLKALDLLKPKIKGQKIQQRGRSVSRFRSRAQSLQAQKQTSQNTLHLRSANFSPIPNKPTLIRTTKLNKKCTTQLKAASKSNKQNMQSSSPEMNKQKLGRIRHFQIKLSKKQQSKSKGRKKGPNKQIFIRKLKL